MRGFAVKLLAAVAVLAGCASAQLPRPPPLTDCVYVAIDPVPVQLVAPRAPTGQTSEKFDPLDADAIRAALPHDIVKMQAMELSASGGVKSSFLTVGVKDGSYVVRYDDLKYVMGAVVVTVEASTPPKVSTPRFRPPYPATGVQDVTIGPADVVIPVFIGIGSRLSASFRVTGGDVALDIGGVAAASSENRLTGAVQVQTHGLSNEKTTPLIGLPVARLDQASINAALMSLGQVKARMYDPAVKPTPSVVGYCSVLADTSRDSVVGLILASQPTLAVMGKKKEEGKKVAVPADGGAAGAGALSARIDLQ